MENFTKGFIRELGDEFEITVFSRKKTNDETVGVWATSEKNDLLQSIYLISYIFLSFF